MGAYAIRRLLWIPVTVILATIVVFLLVRFIPGNIIDTIQAQMEAYGGGTIDRPAIERALGLDVPVYVQYGRWISNIVFHGNLGTSLRNQQPITPLIINRIPLTFELGLMGIIIGLLNQPPYRCVFSHQARYHSGLYPAQYRYPPYLCPQLLDWKLW